MFVEEVHFCYLSRAVYGRIAECLRERAEVDLDLVEIDDGRPNPETQFEQGEDHEVLRRCLGGLHPKERAVLELFYLREMTPQQICEELSMTMTQFRLCKSRAKIKLSALGRRMTVRACTAQDEHQGRE